MKPRPSQKVAKQVESQEDRRAAPDADATRAGTEVPAARGTIPGLIGGRKRMRAEKTAEKEVEVGF